MDLRGRQNDACWFDAGMFGIGLPLSFQTANHILPGAGSDLKQDVAAICDDDILFLVCDLQLPSRPTVNLLDDGRHHLAQDALAHDSPP